MKMLIVDDDPLIVKSLSLTLSREDDIEVIGCAKDGAEALRLLEEETPDIVLMTFGCRGSMVLPPRV